MTPDQLRGHIEALTASVARFDRDAAGETSAAATALRDGLAALQQVEAELALEIHRWTEYLQHAPMAYLVTDADGVVHEANLAATILLRRSANDLVGASLTSLVAEDDRARWHELLAADVRDLEANVTVMLAVGDDWIRARIRTAPSAEPRRAAWTIEDVELLERAAEADRLAVEIQRKDDLLTTLGHEVRNPLAPIRAAVELLRHHGATLTDEQRQRAVEVVGRQADHLAHLVDDLLDVSRLTAGKVRLRRRALDLREVIEQSHDVVRAQAQLHRLTFVLPPEPVRVQGDAVRLRQVFVNLLGNALKFTQRGRSVTVRLTTDADRAIVTVTDEGVGIAPEHLEQLFAPLDDAEQSTDSPGLGLGLELVRQLVDLHRGSVSVRSEGIGRGSEFTVSLPLARPAAPSARDRDDTAEERPELHLLVVDDNVDGARMLGHLLEVHGYRTSLAFDGAGAIELFARTHPDAVLLDLQLPDIDGFEVARHMRLQWPGVHLIAVTGHGDERVRSRVRETGFAAHLLKPVEIDALRRALDKIGDKRR